MKKMKGFFKSAVDAVVGKPVPVKAACVYAGEYTGYVEQLPSVFFPSVYDCVLLVVKGADNKEAVMHYSCDVPSEFLRDFLRRGNMPQGAMAVYTQVAHSKEMHPGVLRCNRALTQVLSALSRGAGLSPDRVFTTTLDSGDMIYHSDVRHKAAARYGFFGGMANVDGGMLGARYEVTEIAPGAGLPLYSARIASGFPGEEDRSREAYIRHVRLHNGRVEEINGGRGDGASSSAAGAFQEVTPRARGGRYAESYHAERGARERGR